MNEFLLNFDPKLRTAIIGAFLMFVVDYLSYRKSVRKAQTVEGTVPDWAWELTALKVIAGFTGGYGVGGAAEVVTPPEVPAVVMHGLYLLAA